MDAPATKLEEELEAKEIVLDYLNDPAVAAIRELFKPQGINVEPVIAYQAYQGRPAFFVRYDVPIQEPFTLMYEFLGWLDAAFYAWTMQFGRVNCPVKQKRITASRNTAIIKFVFRP